MKNLRIIEFAVMTALILILGKGLFSGVFIGIAVSLLKVIHNKLVGPEKALPSPFQSIGIGALAGLASNLIRFIL